MSKKLLWVGDAGVPTGLAKVTHSILDVLKELDWDIHVLGINYYGDPHGYDYKLYPACRPVDTDMFGFSRIQTIIKTVKPDLVCLLHDPWNLYNYIQLIRQCEDPEIKNVPLVAYIPVDAENMRYEWASALNDLHRAIFYTEFGYEVCKASGYGGSGTIIPHGVDLDIFSPVDKVEARTKLGIQDKLPKDAFIIGNVNQNQVRKRLDITVRAFYAWLKKSKVRNAWLYMHAKSQGVVDLNQLATYYERVYKIKPKGRLITLGDNMTSQGGVAEQYMKYVYGSFDVHVNSCGGEGWGLCVDPNTLIQLEDEVKEIKSLEKGDKVLTEKGTFSPVVARVSKRDKVLEIKARGLLKTRITEDHSVFGIKKPRPLNFYKKRRHYLEDAEWYKAKDIKRGSLVSYPRPFWTDDLPSKIDLLEEVPDSLYNETYVWLKMGYKPASHEYSLSSLCKNYDVTKKVAEKAVKAARGTIQLQPSFPSYFLFQAIKDSIKQPNILKVNRFIPVDDRLLELLGWYLAEGSCRSGRGVEWDFNLNELHIAKRLSGYVKELFGVDSVVNINGEHKCRLRLCSSIISTFFSNLCGRGAHNKNIDARFLRASKHLSPLVWSYFEGDGHKSETSYSVTTVSESLCWQVHQVLAAVGIHSSICAITHPSSSWILSVGGEAMERFYSWCNKPLEAPPNRTRSQMAYVTDRFIFVPVDSIRQLPEQEVMDIQVEGTHSFVGNGLLLHNSNLESMACRIPNIIPDFGALAEWTKGAAHLVPCNNTLTWEFNTIGHMPSEEEMTEAFDKMYTDENYRIRKGQEGYNLVQRPFFKWEAIAHRFHNVFRAVLQEIEDKAKEADGGSIQNGVAESNSEDATVGSPA